MEPSHLIAVKLKTTCFQKVFFHTNSYDFNKYDYDYRNDEICSFFNRINPYEKTSYWSELSSKSFIDREVFPRVLSLLDREQVKSSSFPDSCLYSLRAVFSYAHIRKSISKRYEKIVSREVKKIDVVRKYPSLFNEYFVFKAFDDMDIADLKWPILRKISAIDSFYYLMDKQKFEKILRDYKLKIGMEGFNEKFEELNLSSDVRPYLGAYSRVVNQYMLLDDRPELSFGGRINSKNQFIKYFRALSEKFYRVKIVFGSVSDSKFNYGSLAKQLAIGERFGSSVLGVRDKKLTKHFFKLFDELARDPTDVNRHIDRFFEESGFTFY